MGLKISRMMAPVLNQKPRRAKRDMKECVNNFQNKDNIWLRNLIIFRKPSHLFQFVEKMINSRTFYCEFACFFKLVKKIAAKINLRKKIWKKWGNEAFRIYKRTEKLFVIQQFFFCFAKAKRLVSQTLQLRKAKQSSHQNIL